MKWLRNIDAVIIDLDGTMVDTLGDFELALNRMLTELRLPQVSRPFIEATVGKGSEHLIRSTFDYVKNQALAPANHGEFAIENIVFDDAWQSYQRHYLACNGQASAVYPGILEGLQTLRQIGMPMACLTNKPTSFARPLLKSKGLDSFFSFVFGGDSFAKKKPDPLPLLKTCEALGTAPARTLMVGDSSNDAQAAYAAGCPVVLMTYGYNHGEDIRQSVALAHFDSLTQLLSV